jgi:hypothetical protein
MSEDEESKALIVSRILTTKAPTVKAFQILEMSPMSPEVRPPK